VLWALLYFPREAKLSFNPIGEKQLINGGFNASLMGNRRGQAHVDEMVKRRDEALRRIDQRAEAERVRQSFAGTIGHAIEPVIRPLGFDWKIGIGLLASFAAREVLVSTLGLVYGVGKVEADEDNPSLRKAMQAEKIYTPLVGLSLMVFFVLACQCMSTLAVVRRETNSWRWPAFMFGYMTVLAYVGSLLVYQGGRLLGLG
jgi:ferrous iron transport protein B